MFRALKLKAVLTIHKLFEADYTLPGASENAHKIGIPISAKGLTWQRQRASAREDTYFSEFLEELWYAFDQEFRVNDVGKIVRQRLKGLTFN